MQKSEIMREILAYLADHPDAQDTLAGIFEWWLLERKITYQMTPVKEALAELANKGLVLEVSGADSQIHYRVNRHKLSEIRSMLNPD